MVPTRSRERPGEILSMTASRIPSYAMWWPFETGRPAWSLTRKALSHNHKIRELGAQLPVEQRLANLKALTERPRTSRVRRCRCSHMAAMTIGSRFPADLTRYLSFHVSKRLRVLARRLSALEHPGPSIAARAHDSKWHQADRLCRSAIMVRFLRVIRRAGTGPRAGCRRLELTHNRRIDGPTS